MTGEWLVLVVGAIYLFLQQKTHRTLGNWWSGSFSFALSSINCRQPAKLQFCSEKYAIRTMVTFLIKNLKISKTIKEHMWEEVKGFLMDQYVCSIYLNGFRTDEKGV